MPRHHFSARRGYHFAWESWQNSCLTLPVWTKLGTERIPERLMVEKAAFIKVLPAPLWTWSDMARKDPLDHKPSLRH